MQATSAIPGTAEKMAVMAARLANGDPLYHPEDARCRPLETEPNVSANSPGRKRRVIPGDVMAAVIADLRNDVPTRTIAERHHLCRSVVVRIQREDVRGVRKQCRRQRSRQLDMPVLDVRNWAWR